MSKAYVVNAGLEPIEFRTLFPFWEDHPDVTKTNLEVWQQWHHRSPVNDQADF